MSKQTRAVVRNNIASLLAKARQLDEKSGRAEHRRRLSRGSYTHDPVFKACALDDKAQRARDKADRLARTHWWWNPHATAHWVLTSRDARL